MGQPIITEGEIRGEIVLSRFPAGVAAANLVTRRLCATDLTGYCQGAMACPKDVVRDGPRYDPDGKFGHQPTPVDVPPRPVDLRVAALGRPANDRHRHPSHPGDDRWLRGQDLGQPGQ